MINKPTVFFCVMLCLGTLLFGLDDYRTRIAVLPMSNETGDAQYDAVCSTVTDTVALVLRFLDDYLVSTSDDDPDLERYNAADVDAVKTISEESVYDEILYGNAETTDSGGFKFTLSIYNRSKEAVIIQEEVTAETLLDIFNAADEITLALISHISDIHVGFGSIELIQESGKGFYQVYLDSKRVRNPKKLFKTVLNGSYTLTIHQERMKGDTVVFEKTVEVYEDQTTKVLFSIPPATEEDWDYLEELKNNIVQTASEHEGDIEGFFNKIAEFQKVTQTINYDNDLIKRRDAILDEISKTATSMLQGIITEADRNYYRKKPNFEDALKTYNAISLLVNNVFEYRIIDTTSEGMEGRELIQPFLIERSPDGTLFVIDGTDEVILFSFDPEGSLIASMPLGISIEEYTSGADCVAAVSAGVYYLAPEGDSITVLNKYLETRQTIPIPEYTPVSGESVHLSVSTDGIVYLLTDSQTVVFEPSTDKDSPSERDAIIEQTISTSIMNITNPGLSDIRFDLFSRLNIFSTNAGAVLQLDLLGNLIAEIPLTESEERSQFAIDTLGYFYLSLPEEHRIVKYSPDGGMVTSFGQFGVAPGEFSFPQGLCVDDAGTLYVADSYTGRVQIMQLVSPPILLPEVARYGMRFSERENKTEEAIRKVGNVRERIKIGRSVGSFIGAGLFVGGSLGLHFLASNLENRAIDQYYSYREEAVQEALTEFKSQSTANWIFSRISRIGGYSSFGIGAIFLTSSILMTTDFAVLKRRTIKDLQSVQFDGDYQLDEERYRSLQRANMIGFWTGVMPPIAGGGTALTLYFLKDSFTVKKAAQVTAASIVVPPIFSHLYGGRFHLGLLAAGLIADILALSTLLSIDRLELEDSDIYSQNQTLTVSSTWASMEKQFPLYLLISAACIRLGAGIYDMNNGWKVTHSYNQYKALKKVGPVAEVSVLPIIDADLGMGVSIRIQK